MILMIIIPAGSLILASDANKIKTNSKLVRELTYYKQIGNVEADALSDAVRSQ